MTSLRDCKNIARKVNDMYGNTRGCTSVAITIIRMVREPHEGQEQVALGEIREFVSESQVTDYAVQLYLWVIGVRESRPTWTTFPTERWDGVDGVNPRLSSECYRLALYAYSNEDPTIGNGGVPCE